MSQPGSRLRTVRRTRRSSLAASSISQSTVAHMCHLLLSSLRFATAQPVHGLFIVSRSGVQYYYSMSRFYLSKSGIPHNAIVLLIADGQFHIRHLWYRCVWHRVLVIHIARQHQWRDAHQVLSPHPHLPTGIPVHLSHRPWTLPMQHSLQVLYFSTSLGGCMLASLAFRNNDNYNFYLL